MYKNFVKWHYCDVIMGAVAPRITSLTIVYSAVFQTQIKETSKFRVTGICAGNSPRTMNSPQKMASNAENVIWWRHHEFRSSDRWMRILRHVSNIRESYYTRFHLHLWVACVTDRVLSGSHRGSLCNKREDEHHFDFASRWRHNELDGASNRRRLD